MMSEDLTHFGVKGMRWGHRQEHAEERAAKKAVRKELQVRRGEDALYRSNSFGNPSLAIGTKAATVLLSGVSAGIGIRALRGTKNPSLKKLKIGMTAAGLVLTGISAASTIRDIRDINAYGKRQKEEAKNA